MNGVASGASYTSQLVVQDGLPLVTIQASFSASGGGVVENWTGSFTLRKVVGPPVITEIIDAGTGHDLVVKWSPPQPPDVSSYEVYLSSTSGGTGTTIVHTSEPVVETGSSEYSVVFDNLPSYVPYFVSMRSYQASSDAWSDYVTPPAPHDTDNYASIPVFAVHGLGSDPSIWTTLRDALTTTQHFNHVFPVAGLVSNGVPGETQFEGNALILSNRMEQSLAPIEAETGLEIDSVDIVAHSMGGLIARRYVAGTEPWAGKRSVRQLITLNTPHAGVSTNHSIEYLSFYWAASPLITLLNSWKPALVQLALPAMVLFNADFPVQPGTTIHALAGTGGRTALCLPPSSGCLFGAGLLVACPNDGIVTVGSALDVSHTSEYVDDYCHSSLAIGSVSVAHQDNALINNWISPILKGGAPLLHSSRNRPLAEQALLSSDGSMDAQIVASYCDIVASGQEYEDSVYLDGGATAVSFLRYNASARFSLVSPTLVVWDSLAAVNSGTVHYSTVDDNILFSFDDAEPGLWLVRSDFTSVSDSVSLRCFEVGVHGSIVVDMTASPQDVRSGDSVLVLVSLTDGGLPIQSASVSIVCVARSSDTLQDLQLIDDGTGPDEVDADGVYSGMITETMDSGIVALNLRASKSSSPTFSRLGLAYVHVSPPWTRGDVTDNGVINSQDLIYLVNHVFKSGPPPLPVSATGDANCDSVINSGDIIYLVNYVFKSGPAPGC